MGNRQSAIGNLDAAGPSSVPMRSPQTIQVRDGERGSSSSSPQASGDPITPSLNSWNIPGDPCTFTGEIPDVALLPQMEEKDIEFKRLYLPKDEALVGCWPCVVILHIPITGRLFITQRYVATSVVVFGITLVRIIHLGQVDNVEYMEHSQKLTVKCREGIPLLVQIQKRDGREALSMIQESRNACQGLVLPLGMYDAHTSSSLTVDDVLFMLRNTQVQSLSRDRPVLEEGRQYDNLYQVLQGRLEVHIGDPADLTVLRIMQEGDMFGEMSFLDGGVASATVVPVDDKALVCVLDGKYLLQRIKSNPEFGIRLYKYLSLVLTNRVKTLSRLVPSLNVGKEAGRRSMRRRMSIHESSARNILETPEYYFVYSEVGKSPSDPFKQNQDNYCVTEVNMKDHSKVFFFGVFDGHGVSGHDVSKKVKEKLADEIFKDPESFMRDPRAAIQKGFATTNNLVLLCDFDVEMSGTTAIVAIRVGRKLYIANVGDSRAVLGKKSLTGGQIDRSHGYEAIDLSRDQKPDEKSEMTRIMSMGGHVERSFDEEGKPDGPYRVYVAGEGYPGLAIARSIGDRAGKTCGVIPDPVITEHNIDIDRDKFLILASDGVWEFMSSQRAVAIVGGMTGAESACRQLVFDAKQEWDK
eukprot:TRINITY_DN6851_c0_g1_i5.p1 TRINITY_DN6851_c0_g1~~TRINITY_DN6851_c0_g1_i5.p1  ORF type:complete len:638 (+),score=130.11 TRINITY_DN6851_c0_g1_i5:61-1974(+)